LGRARPRGGCGAVHGGRPQSLASVPRAARGDGRGSAPTGRGPPRRRRTSTCASASRSSPATRWRSTAGVASGLSPADPSKRDETPHSSRRVTLEAGRLLLGREFGPATIQTPVDVPRALVAGCLPLGFLRSERSFLLRHRRSRQPSYRLQFRADVAEYGHGIEEVSRVDGRPCLFAPSPEVHPVHAERRLRPKMPAFDMASCGTCYGRRVSQTVSSPPAYGRMSNQP